MLFKKDPSLARLYYRRALLLTNISSYLFHIKSQSTKRRYDLNMNVLEEVFNLQCFKWLRGKIKVDHLT